MHKPKAFSSNQSPLRRSLITCLLAMIQLMEAFRWKIVAQTVCLPQMQRPPLSKQTQLEDLLGLSKLYLQEGQLSLQ